ncbi:unnamed protein product [Bemisia tabaci]|uniref:Amino acid transporter transmembrane domain-containing protein n=1 Tax=Bemisia tabaci TaxID=7038 RepID=A0A9P0F3S5_BEMTA|nr:unnamed protein product [Bemisia tabaci]
MGFKEKSDSQAVLDVEVSGDSPDLDEHYEPHDYQPPGKSASYCEALFILVKASLGTGILCMPRAFYNAGYVLGAVGTIFAGVISVLSVHLIANTEHELCRRKRIPRMTYPETLEASFEMGPGNVKRYKGIARVVCTVALTMQAFGSDCVYAIFIAVNIKEICDHFFTPAPLKFYLLCLLGPFIVICWIRNLKYLAPGSTIGTACSICCIGAAYYYIFSQPITTEGRKTVGSLRDFALFFGAALFAQGDFGVVSFILQTYTL